VHICETHGCVDYKELESSMQHMLALSQCPLRRHFVTCVAGTAPVDILLHSLCLHTWRLCARTYKSGGLQIRVCPPWSVEQGKKTCYEGSGSVHSYKLLRDA
jgi:hypothetical protein